MHILLCTLLFILQQSQVFLWQGPYNFHFGEEEEKKSIYGDKANLFGSVTQGVMTQNI